MSYKSNQEKLIIDSAGQLTIQPPEEIDASLTLESQQSAQLTISGDTTNQTGEIGTASIRFNQDGALTSLIIGTVQTADKDPDGATFTGTLANALLVGATSGENAIQFGANSAVRMTLNTTNLGLGIETPTFNSAGRYIHIHEPSTNAAGIHITNSATGSGATDGLIIARWNNGVNYISTYENENIEIHVGAVQKLAVTSNRVFLNGTASRGYSGYIVTSSNDSIAEARRLAGYIEWQTDIGAIGTNYFVSDERKKENIQPSTVSAENVLKQIEFIEFDWKEGSGGSGHIDCGVSAQQLEAIDSRFVRRLSDDSLMIHEPTLIPYLAKAIKELSQKIEVLQAEIETLKAK